MNLSAYDNIKEKIDKKKTWVDINKKLLLSREIKYRPYVCFLKRYDSETNSYSYFIATLDNPIEDKDCKHTTMDDYGRFKLRLSSIWNETYLSQLESNCNIMCELVEHNSNGDIYSIDL